MTDQVQPEIAYAIIMWKDMRKGTIKRLSMCARTPIRKCMWNARGIIELISAAHAQLADARRPMVSGSVQTELKYTVHNEQLYWYAADVPLIPDYTAGGIREGVAYTLAPRNGVRTRFQTCTKIWSVKSRGPKSPLQAKGNYVELLYKSTPRLV